MSVDLMRRLVVVGSRERAGHQEDQTMVRCLELSGSLPHFQRRERGWKWIIIDNNLSCLHDEGSIKIPKAWDSESFLVEEHIHVLGGWFTPNSKQADLSPCVSLHLAVHLYLSHILYHVVSINVFP